MAAYIFFFKHRIAYGKGNPSITETVPFPSCTLLVTLLLVIGAT